MFFPGRPVDKVIEELTHVFNIAALSAPSIVILDDLDMLARSVNADGEMTQESLMSMRFTSGKSARFDSQEKYYDETWFI